MIQTPTWQTADTIPQIGVANKSTKDLPRGYVISDLGKSECHNLKFNG